MLPIYDHSFMILSLRNHLMWRHGTLRNMLSKVSCASIFFDPDNKRWLVQWALDANEDDTWEPFEILKDADLPDDGPKKRPSRKRGNTPISDPTTHNNANQTTTPTQKHGRRNTLQPASPLKIYKAFPPQEALISKTKVFDFLLLSLYQVDLEL